jgi:hypothetical protein
LPVDRTVGGLTAHLTATGNGFSLQPANSLGFTPVGFSGYSVYPNGVYQSDLKVDFSNALTNFSILYAPEEYACDSSALMRVTAYMDAAYVGTNTMRAEPGTWPSATLSIGSTQPFNSVVIHYDSAPPTGGDYGPIFMADNMSVMLAPIPGDYDSNGVVDWNDYVAWQQQFGATVNPPGSGPDGNINGVVDAGDYVVWRKASPLPASVYTIPEPGTLTLIYFGTAAVYRRLRFRNR